MDATVEEGCGEEGIRNPLPAEPMALHQVEGTGDRRRVQPDALHVRVLEVDPGQGKGVSHGDCRGEALTVGHDMDQLMKDGGRDDESHIVIGELIQEEAAHSAVVRQLWHMGVDQDVGINSSPHA